MGYGLSGVEVLLGSVGVVGYGMVGVVVCGVVRGKD